MWKPRHQKRKEKLKAIGLIGFVTIGFPVLGLLGWFVGEMINQVK